MPNLLVNGSSGIAVGMATNIPPHNLNEVMDGCLALLRNPETALDDLIELIPAPDFPTAGIIYGMDGVREGYRTGRGRVVMRAKTHFEEIDRGSRAAIIVDELPYQVNKRVLLERIAELVNEKKLEGISDIRDESDKSGMRVVFELKRNEVPEVVLNNLYKQTQLQDTFGINMVALVDGQPRLLNLKQMIEAFLSHRREVVTRRTVFELREARKRGHVLEGLAVALANIDEFIAIIKAAPTPPVAKTGLMARAWDSSLVRETADAGGQRHGRVPARGAGSAIRTARGRPVPAVGRAGGADPADATAAPDRARAGQDRQRVPRGDGEDCRSPRHPRAAFADHGHHRRRAARPEERVRRRAAFRNRPQRAGPR